MEYVRKGNVRAMQIRAVSIETPYKTSLHLNRPLHESYQYRVETWHRTNKVTPAISVTKTFTAPALGSMQVVFCRHNQRDHTRHMKRKIELLLKYKVQATFLVLHFLPNIQPSEIGL